MDAYNPDRCPVYAPQSFFGAMGCAASIIFTVFGASYGTAKSSGAIFSSGIMRPERLMQNTVIISGDLIEKMPLHMGFLQLGAGISVGLCGLAAGFAIGIVGDAGVRASTQQPRLYVGMVLILIFAEVLGLYGVIDTASDHYFSLSPPDLPPPLLTHRPSYPPDNPPPDDLNPANPMPRPLHPTPQWPTRHQAHGASLPPDDPADRDAVHGLAAVLEPGVPVPFGGVHTDAQGRCAGVDAGAVILARARQPAGVPALERAGHRRGRAAEQPRRGPVQLGRLRVPDARDVGRVAAAAADPGPAEQQQQGNRGGRRGQKRGARRQGGGHESARGVVLLRAHLRGSERNCGTDGRDAPF
ncbi:hypothetical protein TruAng_001219 [Truncatella angustata]|nr:hypothetical protein TruAng_001219 [Truncatella angustata]